MLEDKDILELFKVEGRKEYAFNLLLRKYQERLYWHIRKMTLEHEETNDLLQNVLIKIWNTLDSFRGDSKLYTWLYRIATNETLTFLKKKRITSFLSLSNYSTVLENKVVADTEFDGSALQRILHRSIARLPDKQRLVFSMRYFEEMKYEEISAVLNVTVGALKASYHHAYSKIKKDLDNID